MDPNGVRSAGEVGAGGRRSLSARSVLACTVVVPW